MTYKKIRSLLLIVTVCCISCISLRPEADISASQVKNKSVVIFVPGYYGSALVDKTSGEVLHLTTGKAIFGGPSLAINGKDLAIDDAKEIKSVGILDRFTIFPGYAPVDIYGAILDGLENMFSDSNSVVVLPFSYDWRDSNVNAAQKLGALVIKVRMAGAKRIAIVAHSNGGVVTSYYLRFGAQPIDDAKENWAGAKMIDGVVLMGTPFHGTVRSFYNTQRGVSFGPAKNPLSPLAMSTFPSLYELMPNETSFLGPDRKPMGISIYNVGTWEARKWGLFSDQNLSTKILATRHKYLTAKLKNGRLFAAKILAPSQTFLEPKLPALVVTSHGKRTLNKALWNAKSFDEAGQWSFTDKALFADGDGTITLASATPPRPYAEAFTVKEFSTTKGHAEMTGDPTVHSQIKSFLSSLGF